MDNKSTVFTKICNLQRKYPHYTSTLVYIKFLNNELSLPAFRLCLLSPIFTEWFQSNLTAYEIVNQDWACGDVEFFKKAFVELEKKGLFKDRKLTEQVKNWRQKLYISWENAGFLLSCSKLEAKILIDILLNIQSVPNSDTKEFSISRFARLFKTHRKKRMQEDVYTTLKKLEMAGIIELPEIITDSYKIKLTYFVTLNKIEEVHKKVRDRILGTKLTKKEEEGFKKIAGSLEQELTKIKVESNLEPNLEPKLEKTEHLPKKTFFKKGKTR